MFKPVDAKVSFPALEQGIIEFWRKHAIFLRSVEERPADRTFVFYEGPPTANARPGIHHVLARVFKDLIPRYKTMQGYRVPRKAGWDTHGLPVELEIEKELGLQSKLEIEEYGIAAFNAKCKESVSRYVEEWTLLSERIGFWADLEHPYVTWHNDYIETCWWIFKQLWDHGLVYQDYRVSPYCPRCETTLSDHEVSQGYEEDTPDPSVFVKFRVPSAELRRLGLEDSVPTYFVAWTTTPWTLPGNVALAVKPDAEYVVLDNPLRREGPERIIVARTLKRLAMGDWYAVLDTARQQQQQSERLGQRMSWREAVGQVSGVMPGHLPNRDEMIEEVRTYEGRELVGAHYEPLYEPETIQMGWSQFDPTSGRMTVTKLAPIIGGQEEAQEEVRKRVRGLRRVIAADYVSLDDGTGIVHIAPAFGGEDFQEGKRNGLLFFQPMDLRGIMAEGLPGAGKFAKQADKDIIRDLEERGLMLKSGMIKHTYPFCWRCNTPLLYYAKPSWYIRTTKQKASLLEGNNRINWYPEHIKTGRFGNWLENNVDWAVSRERYWGTPLPFWKCAACGDSTCIGSRAELAERANEKEKAAALDDLHRPFIDEITLPCEKCGGTMRRVPEVADAWYDSGAMPYAQWHYPFENEDEFLKHFPADYICEAIDQTRGWFYTLHAEATLLKATEAVPDSISFKNVIVLGHIQDEKGNKMSKSRGNAAEPWPILDRFGADATRWYMYTAGLARTSGRFGPALVEEGLRRFLLTLWNTYSFFVSYANIDNADPRTPPKGQPPEIDRWLLSELNALIIRVTDELEAYDPTDAARAIDAFVDDLSNWYVRRCRRRFWRGASEADDDKRSAYHTLYTALVTLSKLLAPFTPFIAEEIYQNLVRSLDTEAPDSVHLAEWPVAEHHRIDPAINDETQLVKRVCSMGRAARAKAQIKVRQPVAEVVVKVRTSEEMTTIRRHDQLVLEELNAKALRVIEDETAVVHYDVKPNLPVLGRKYGAGVATIRQGLAAMPAVAVAELVRRGQTVPVEGYDLEAEDILLEAKDHEGFAVAVDSGYAVAVATTITPELADEGLAREIVRRLQDMRRDAGFALADRITTWYSGDDEVARVIRAHAAYIQGETLSTKLAAGEPPADAFSAEHDLEGTKLLLAVRRN
jgi:isoleucyl-tRNA synthetase